MFEFFKENLLAIETSCDETSAALVRGSEIRSNIVASQIDLHKKWGGVVPEAAARAHVEAILPVIEEALGGETVHAVAVTNRPGLVGALSVGVAAAKALCLAWNIPLIGVHHLEGHILSILADRGEIESMFPHLSLVVSGGHTELVWVETPGQYTILGHTIDDAAGEAFDKGARLLGLGYPGGFAIQELAKSGNPNRYPLPRGLSKDVYNFSFSGLKTAVLRLVETEGDHLNRPDAAASLQAAVVDSLVAKATHAIEAKEPRAVSLVGGVAANTLLRTRLGDLCHRYGIEFYTPRLDLCTDNAAMIGIAGSLRLAHGESSGFELDCEPNSPLPGLID